MTTLDALYGARTLDTFEIMARGWITDDLAADDNKLDCWSSANDLAVRELIQQTA